MNDKEDPQTPPDELLDEEGLDEVAGGNTHRTFNPQPDPPANH
jgi:hypothetical protein